MENEQFTAAEDAGAVEDGMESASSFTDDGGSDSDAGSADDGGDGGDDAQAAQSQAQQEKWFLEVDARNRYRTREDAIKSWREAGKRISQLSGYERLLRRYGVDKPSPEMVDTLIRELLEHRTRAKASQSEDGASAAQQQKGSDSSRTVTSDANLTPEQRRALDWLRANGKAAGYVPHEELLPMTEKLKAFEKELAELRGFRQNSESQHLDSLVRHGQSELRTLLKGAKLLSQDPAQAKSMGLFAERALRAWIEEDQDRLDRFQAGGDELAELIREGFEEIETVLNSVRAQQSASYAGKKNAAAGKPPVNTAGKAATQQQSQAQQQRRSPAQMNEDRARKDNWDDPNKKAWELFQSMQGKEVDAE